MYKFYQYEKNRLASKYTASHQKNDMKANSKNHPRRRLNYEITHSKMKASGWMLLNKLIKSQGKPSTNYMPLFHFHFRNK